MNKRTIIGGIAAALVAMAGTAFAQHSASTTAYATSEVLYPFTLSANSATINFGNIIPPSSQDGITGTVIVDMSSNIYYQYSDMDPGQHNRGTVGAASFATTGEGGYSYTVSAPSIVSYSTNPAWGSMTLSFPTSPHLTYPTSSLGLSNSGPYLGYGGFNIGGMLTVPQGQTLGAYSATVSVTAQYP